jgi:hypothetical protein
VSSNPIFVVQKHDASRLHRWLLVKKRGEGADARRNPVSTQPESAPTGLTIEQVALEEGH